MSKLIITAIFFFGIMFPTQIYAQNYVESGNPRDPGFQLVPCNGVDCDFNSLMTLINRVMNFIVYLSIPLAAISISYAGYLYISAYGDTGKIQDAHKMFGKIIWGFVFVLAGWLIVYSIMSALLGPNFMNSKSNLLNNFSGGGGNSGSVNVNSGGSTGGNGNTEEIPPVGSNNRGVTDMKDLQFDFRER